MLTAYFDDSGTHPDSDVVLVAGIMGTEWQINSLKNLWKPHLERPLDGMKPSIRRFHMAQCQASTGEFVGWSRTETDCHQLLSSIIDSHVAVYGVACSRKDWQEIITGDLLSILGNPEGSCIRNCFVKARVWANNCTFDPNITVIFDNRPSSAQRDAKAVFNAFQQQSRNPRFVECAFLDSFNFLPLQAADMIAWEFYQAAKADLGNYEFSRPQLQRVASKSISSFQVASRENIEKIRDLWSEHPRDIIRQVADHFENFVEIS